MASAYDLNLRHLEAVSAIVRTGKVTAAAREVNLSQSALTQAVSKLESQLGQQLFERRTDGVSATPAAVVLTARIERALMLLGDAVRQARGGRRRAASFRSVARQFSMVQLRGVMALARAGSYVGAARDTGISQPSVHRVVRELEQRLGVSLFIRARRGMRPTVIAERFLRSTGVALAELEAGLAELADMALAGQEKIVVGAMPLARAALLPDTIAAFAKLHPRARVRIVDGPYADLLARLRDGEIDLLVGALRDPEPGTDVVQQVLFEAPLHIVAGCSHPLAGSSSITPAALARYPWIIGLPTTPLHHQWLRLFEAQEESAPGITIETSSFVAIRGLLLQGNWLTLLSQDQFRLEQEAGLLVTLGSAIAGSARRIGTTVRTGWQPTRIQGEFLGAVTAQANTERYRKKQ